MYRLTFENVRNNATANSMQGAEIQLLGTVATEAPSVLSINRDASGAITIASPQPGTLQSTTQLGDNATWTDEGPIDGSVTVTPAGSARFFQVLSSSKRTLHN